MYDAHIHLERYEKNQISRCIQVWKNYGIKGVLAVSHDLRSSYQTLELKQTYPDFVYAAIGYHPEQPLPNPLELNEMENLIQQEKPLLSALGEVGLPYYELNRLGNPPLEAYIELLSHFAQIGCEYELPLVVHAVHEHAEIVYQTLQHCHVKKAHFHWLKAPANTLEKIIEANYYISVTPEICYKERDQRMVANVPLAQLLLETDGPWPFAGPFIHQKTTPLFLTQSCQIVASIKNISQKELEAICDRNFEKLFGECRN